MYTFSPFGSSRCSFGFRRITPASFRDTTRTALVAEPSQMKPLANQRTVGRLGAPFDKAFSTSASSAGGTRSLSADGGIGSS